MNYALEELLNQIRQAAEQFGIDGDEIKFAQRMTYFTKMLKAAAQVKGVIKS